MVLLMQLLMITLLFDFNFQCLNNEKGYEVFLQFANDLNLTNCDYLESARVGYTYMHDGLCQKSFIDHFFVHCDLLTIVNSVKIVENGSNLSDHLPIVLSITLPSCANQDPCVQPKW